MDAWCSPERIRQAHLPDEISNFTRHFRPSGPTPSTLPGPIQAESPAMPGHDRFRLDEITSAEHQSDHRCISHAHKRRSTSASRTRPRCDLRSTFIWWRRARISSCRTARVWKQDRRAPRKERNRVNIESGEFSSRSEPTSTISTRTEFLAGTAAPSFSFQFTCA